MTDSIIRNVIVTHTLILLVRVGPVPKADGDLLV